LEFWESLEPLNYLSQPDLSIIIPTLNEALDLPLTLARIPQDPSIEVLVVDGGSLDGTLESAASWGAKVISSSRGRARQMNTGAGEAKGQTLLFLHADTLLPEGFKNHIDQVLFRKENVAGAFPLTFEPLLPGLKYIEKLANWRARALQLPYGDQALFLRANLFRALGGFKDIPIMEDVELIGRLKREGRIGIAQAAVITSSRRWKDQGVWRTTLRNQVALGAFRAGISLDRLARWYHKGSQKAPGKMAEER
jgi:rSAM/selenodomain-associated transferase 2